MKFNKPAILLFFLAPLFGEYLLGNLKFSEIFYVPFIAPLYGAGALLIRETTRRAGRGPATMLTLGVAYALIEEGLVDQMLFNQLYFTGQDQFGTFIEALGLDAWLTILVLAMHAIWSTYIPITLVETLFPERGTKPWLGIKGLIITSVIFIGGSSYLCYIIYLEENFFASVPQLIGTTLAIILLVTAAFKVRSSTRSQIASVAPKPWIVGTVSFIASSFFMLTDMLPGWSKVGSCLLLVFLFFRMASNWACREGWSEIHHLSIVGGGILTYAWLGIFMGPESGPKEVIDYIGSAIFVCGAIGLLAAAVRKLLRKSELNSSNYEL